MRALILQKLKFSPSKAFLSYDSNSLLKIYSIDNSSFLYSNLSSVSSLIYSQKLFFLPRRFAFWSILNFLITHIRNLLKGSYQMFFLEFRVVGLGYKVFKYRRDSNLKVLSLKLGFSHLIKYTIPSTVRVITGKRRFLVFSNSLETINILCKHFFFLKKKNPYKTKGLILPKVELRLKQGKRQQR